MKGLKQSVRSKKLRMKRTRRRNPEQKGRNFVGKHIPEFDHKDEVIGYVEANIKRESVVLVRFDGICPRAPVMKYEEFKKQTGKFVFKDDSSSKRDYKRLNRVRKIQLFQRLNSSDCLT